MPISHPHKVIFVHVPRSGGSGIEQVLGICGDDNKGTLTPPRPDMLFGLVETKFFGMTLEAKVLQHLNARDIRKRVGEDVYGKYFKFAFVRNPYDRVVSTYHIRQKLLPRIKMSFRDFVQKRIAERKPAGLTKLLQSKAEKALEDQFESQHQFISDENGRILVDFVGKYENLAADFKKICERLGLKAELPWVNRSRHEDYRGYYDEETKRTVAGIYKKDIKAFAYEF